MVFGLVVVVALHLVVLCHHAMGLDYSQNTGTVRTPSTVKTLAQLHPFESVGGEQLITEENLLPLVD